MCNGRNYSDTEGDLGPGQARGSFAKQKELREGEYRLSRAYLAFVLCLVLLVHKVLCCLYSDSCQKRSLCKVHLKKIREEVRGLKKIQLGISGSGITGNLVIAGHVCQTPGVHGGYFFSPTLLRTGDMIFIFLVCDKFLLSGLCMWIHVHCGSKRRPNCLRQQRKESQATPPFTPSFSAHHERYNLKSRCGWHITSTRLTLYM